MNGDQKMNNQIIKKIKTPIPSPLLAGKITKKNPDPSSKRGLNGGGGGGVFFPSG
jgi:hypothetical protein